MELLNATALVDDHVSAQQYNLELLIALGSNRQLPVNLANNYGGYNIMALISIEGKWSK
jgi:hypothetical protein